VVQDFHWTPATHTVVFNTLADRIAVPEERIMESLPRYSIVKGPSRIILLPIGITFRSTPHIRIVKDVGFTITRSIIRLFTATAFAAVRK
jgi:hypothetical protein